LVLVVHRRPVVVLALEVPSVGDASQGAAGVAVVGASVARSVAPGDVVPAPRPSGVMSPELSGLSQPGSPSSPVS
jgi:hypothetical protein